MRINIENDEVKGCQKNKTRYPLDTSGLQQDRNAQSVQQSEMAVPWSLFISVCGFASMMCRASLMRRICLLS